MRNKQFYNLGHATNYLTNSLVTFDHRPAWVVTVGLAGRYFRVEFQYTDDGEYAQATTVNPKWDFTPVPLGFTGYIDNDNQMVKSAIYTFRTPRRMWKIGLAPNNLCVRAPSIMDNKNYCGDEDIIRSRELAKTIKNEFPSLYAANKISLDNKIAVAFSRRFCVENEFLFYKYMGVPVGKTDGTECTLFPEFVYLSQVLKEDLDK